MESEAVDQSLVRLQAEWKNRHSEPMRKLLQKVLYLKRAFDYSDIFAELVMRVHRRHASNEDYVARLLVLVDERPMPILHLQPMIGIQQGHLYRTLERAGVVFEAATGSSASADQVDYHPWGREVYVDPVSREVIRGGEIRKLADDEDPFDLPICYDPVVVPVPAWPKLKIKLPVKKKKGRK